VWHHQLVLVTLRLSACAAGALWLAAVSGCGARPPSTSGPASPGAAIGNTAVGDGAPTIDERMSTAAFQDLLERAALRSIELELVNVDVIGDVVEGRVMADARGFALETCGWPDVELFVDADDRVYVVPAGYRGDASVTEYQKRAMPRCARYIYALPDGLAFAHRIELDDE
jgi:hypothetical protein